MDYANGKIYMLEPTCEYDEGDVYYGHTASTLVKRLSQHKKSSNKAKSKILMDKYGRDNIKIVLLEECPCDNISQLKVVEAKYQRENKCVNKNIAGRTKKEYQQDKREEIADRKKKYHAANREEIADQKKKYRQDNRDAISEQAKKYYQGNREAIIEQNKERYQDNREAILERAKDYHADNREAILEQMKEYRAANREKINAKKREQYAKNKSKLNI